MRKTVVLLFVTLLATPSVFCTSSLLRLERTDQLGPGAVWEEVPANTLPITTEGAFQDTYETDAGYYRMRIDPGDEWGFPLNVPLKDVPRTAVDIAQELLDSLRDGQHGLDEAMLGPIAFPVYTPGIDGPAYMEFAMLSPQPEPPDLPFERARAGLLSNLSGERPLVIGDCGAPAQGFILVSLNEGDFPVVGYSTEGSTRTECLRRMCKTSAVRIVRYDSGFMAAEDEKGKILAYLGAPPVYYPDEILQYCDQEVEDYADPQGEKVPNPPPFEGKAYGSYEEFQKDWLESKRFNEARKRRREAAEIHWDIQLGRLPETINIVFCQETTILKDKVVKDLALDNPDLATYKILQQGVLIHGKEVGTTPMHVLFGDGSDAEYLLVVSEKPLSAEQPTGWTSWEYWWADHEDCQRCYTQEPGTPCVSGCGATAWALLYGWWDCCVCNGYKTLSGDLIAGCPTPLNNNSAVRDCIWYVVDRIDTYCVGSQGATNPWDMYRGYRWAENRGCGISISTKRTAPCLAWTWDGPRDRAIDEVKNNHRPSIVGFGCASAHYALAYGYKYRRYTTPGVTWARQRRLRINMGWGGCPREWKDAEDLWFAARTIIW